MENKNNILGSWLVAVIVVIVLVIAFAVFKGGEDTDIDKQNRPSLTSEPRASEEVEEFPEIEVIDGLDKG